MLVPLDPSIHKPISVRQMLNRKLRWMTLGGQYDWTKKEYPEKARGEEVPFPPDIAAFLRSLVGYAAGRFLLALAKSSPND
jgi:alkylated DNA repair protein alkB family protein 1